MLNVSTNVSNQYGRALEYAIVAEMAQKLQSQLQLTPRAARDQARDSNHYFTLLPNIKQNYQLSAEKIYGWLASKISLSSGLVTLDRLPDSAGAGELADVTDIKIFTNSVHINLSIKRNHKALKHQRPSSTAQQCGYEYNSPEDISFRENYATILDAFKSGVGSSTRFSNLDKNIIKNHLYQPVCKLVADFINGHCTQDSHADFLFRFLVGNEDFYKITLFDRPIKRKYLLIQEFIGLGPATSVAAKVLLTKYCNYLHLSFSNGWNMRIRLHTASSEIGNSK